MFSVGGFLCGRHGSISLRVFFVRYEKIFLVASFVRKTNERIFRIVFVRYEKNFRAVRFFAAGAARGTAGFDVLTADG